MNTSEPDQIVSKMRTREQEGDATRTIQYVNAFTHDTSLPLLSVGYEAPATTAASSAPLQSRVSVWGQSGLSTSGYARAPVTFWGGGQWADQGGVLYESATTEKVDDGAIWVHDAADFGPTSRAACFSDATSVANPVYQTLEMRGLKTTDITASQLGTLDQIVNESSRSRAPLAYSLEPEAASKRMLGGSAAYINLDLSAQVYNSLDPVRRPLHHGSTFQSEEMDTAHPGSPGVALDRLENYTSRSNSDDILTASAQLQRDCRYHPDTTSPLVVVGSSNIPDHHLSVNSFENVNHAPRLTAYFGHPRDNFSQGNIVTGTADHDISDITSLLLPRSAMSMAVETATSVSASTNFPHSLTRSWDSTPSPTDRSSDLDLVELVAHPLQDQSAFLAKVKNTSSSCVGVSSSVCVVPTVSGDGKEIRGISFHNHENSLAEASLYDICSKMRSKWQLGCIALAHR